MNPIDCKHTITIDFETYYSKDFSLSKMTTQEYIRDERFEVICVAAKLDDGKTRFCWGDLATIRAFLLQLPWEDACLVAHNAQFDAAILEWIYDIHPKAYFCTMFGARPNVVPYTGRMSLAKVAAFFKVGVKGTEVVNALGKRRHHFTGEAKLRYLVYCIKDVDLCYDIYKLETADLPSSEYIIISLTVRKFVRPQLALNLPKLELALEEEILRRQNMINSLAEKFGVTDVADVKKRLMSNAKFAAELRLLGVEPPMKESPTTGKQTYAFAKADLAFQEMQEHSDPMVRALVATRLGVKSTQMESRLKTFVRVAACADRFAIPLLYYGAHTGRFSGLGGLNLQNLPRGSVLREAIEAPPGYEVIAGDLSQIEARITAMISGQSDLVAAFGRGEDVYSLFASDLYGRVVTKADKTERFIGKTCILGLGFGLGHVRFRESTNSNAALFGIEMDELDERESRRIVNFYRRKNPFVAGMWTTLNGAIEAMHMGSPYKIEGVPVTFMKNRVVLPNGCQIHYPDLQENWYDCKKEETWDGWSYDYRGKRKKLYGGALLENIVQALARIVLTNAESLLARKGLFAALSVHDELIYVEEHGRAGLVERAINLALTQTVPWCSELPLEVESDRGSNYAECK